MIVSHQIILIARCFTANTIIRITNYVWLRVNEKIGNLIIKKGINRRNQLFEQHKEKSKAHNEQKNKIKKS